MRDGARLRLAKSQWPQIFLHTSPRRCKTWSCCLSKEGKQLQFYSRNVPDLVYLKVMLLVWSMQMGLSKKKNTQKYYFWTLYKNWWPFLGASEGAYTNKETWSLYSTCSSKTIPACEDLLLYARNFHMCSLMYSSQQFHEVGVLTSMLSA